MQKEQYVCLICGFNIVDYHPDNCPFCGAPKVQFITSEECSVKFKVTGTPVNEKVTCLNTVPSLGIEHAAYRIEAGAKTYMIDCPSSYDKSLTPVNVITFTHHHFLGASNQYRELFSCKVNIHKLDSLHKICSPFSFDVPFEGNFTENGVEAFHINGHTPGFTFYIFEDILLVCDYVFLKNGDMSFNPYGPKSDTREGGVMLSKIIEGRKFSKVCGFNYVVDFEDWKPKFDSLFRKD